MKIAVLGGGISGLTAAYYLAKKNHQVTIFEKETAVGGLAGGFKQNNWDWYLEKTIHHIFSNDTDLLNFAKEIGFNKIFFKKPETASLYSNPKVITQKSKTQLKSQNYSIFSLDSPVDLIRFPLLGLIDKLRAGVVMVFLKLSPPLSLFESMTAGQFLARLMGKKNWEILWQELFRKKFGKYAGNILASFIWARIKKRTAKLGYPEGGFQALINHLENQSKNLRINVLTNCEVKNIAKTGEKFVINHQEFDTVISTLPTPALIEISKDVFPAEYLDRLKKIKYLHSVSLILETEKPILKNIYWLNIVAPNIPIMGLFQQTNFVEKKHYAGKNILYCGWYVAEDDKLWSLNKNEIINYVFPYIKKISNSQFLISNSWLFKARFAQPIFDKEFLKNKPEMITPVKNFFIANLDMTYPYDRGVNYAVKLGKEVAELL